MTSVIFKNVRLLNFEDSEGMTSPQDVVVSNGKIVTIGKDLPTANVTKVMDNSDNFLNLDPRKLKNIPYPNYFKYIFTNFNFSIFPKRIISLFFVNNA